MVNKKTNDIFDYKPRKYVKKYNVMEEYFEEGNSAEDKEALFEHAPVFYDENTYVLPRNFESRLRQSDEDLKLVYSEIKNEILSYKTTKSKMLKMVEVFRANGVVAKVRIKGKSLYVYLKLQADTIDASFIKTVDKSHRKGYEEVPCEIKVTGKLKCKRTIQLIGLMMDAFGIEKKKNFTPVNYVEKYPYAENAVIEGKNMILR